MWQSQIESETVCHVAIAFPVIKGGAHMCFVDITDITATMKHI